MEHHGMYVTKVEGMGGGNPPPPCNGVKVGHREPQCVCGNVCVHVMHMSNTESCVGM